MPFFQQHLLCVLWSHLGNSHIIADFFFIFLSGMVICAQHSLDVVTDSVKAQMKVSFLTVKYFKACTLFY